jgi:hypothetical protein
LIGASEIARGGEGRGGEGREDEVVRTPPHRSQGERQTIARFPCNNSARLPPLFSNQKPGCCDSGTLEPRAGLWVPPPSRGHVVSAGGCGALRAGIIKRPARSPLDGGPLFFPSQSQPQRNQTIELDLHNAQQKHIYNTTTAWHRRVKHPTIHLTAKNIFN